MGARGRQQGAALGREAEQPRARLALALARVGEALPPARADLDLRLDQLARHRLGEDRIGRRRLLQLLEAVVERQRMRVEDRELLLDSDREVR
jgi:hypothetical protein